jgi:hypothetical protein
MQKRTIRFRMLAFAVVGISMFLCVYALGSNHYTHQFYHDRPSGVHKGNLGKIAGQTFRRVHPYLLYGVPIALASLASLTPRINFARKLN